MDELIEWLRGVLDEDKARISAPEFCGGPWPSAEQMLADIAAKTAIVKMYVAFRDAPERMTDVRSDSWWRALDAVVRRHAAAYADRPGYREEWRP